MQIQMIEEDFVGASTGACNCPIYNAMQRILPCPWQSNKWFVGRINLQVENTWDVKTPLPVKAMEFIRDHDSGTSPKPINFDLPLPKQHYKYCED